MPIHAVDRRGFLRRAALALAATQVGLVGSAHAQALNTLIPNRSGSLDSEPEHTPGNLMISSVARMATQEGTGVGAVRPFQVAIPASQLAELPRRIEATRFPSKELVADRSQGV